MSFVTQENRVTVHRGQATLPQVLCRSGEIMLDAKPVGAWLARDGGVSGKY